MTLILVLGESWLLKALRLMETWKPSWLLLPRHVKSWGMMSWLEWSNMPQREKNGGSGIMMKTTSPRRSFKMLSSKTSSFQISSKRHFCCLAFDSLMMISPKKWNMSCEDVGGKFLKSSSNSSVEKNIFNWQVVVSYFEKKYANLQSVFSSHFLKMKLLQNPPDSGKSPQRFPPFFLPLSESQKKLRYVKAARAWAQWHLKKRRGAHHNKVNQGESPLIVVVLQKLEAIPQWTRKYGWYWAWAIPTLKTFLW